MKKGLAFAFVAAAAATAIAGVAAPSAAAAVPPNCWTVVGSAHDPALGRGPWTYTHTVSWCGALGSFTSTTEPRIGFGSPDGSCVWQGIKRKERQLTAQMFTTLSMGEFRCTDASGVHQVNPWVSVTAYPDGRYGVDGGTA